MNDLHSQSEQKLRGGYYTPPDLASFLVRWVATMNPKDVLEPSCGDGIFLEKLARYMNDPLTTGFEIDRDEAAKARGRAAELGLRRTTIHNTDFLAWATEALDDGRPHFDAIVGNPPFIRYQYLPSPFQLLSETIFAKLGCQFTKHTNAWVPFILASFALLRPGGRLAMVVPAEIIHVMHAGSLRDYLKENATRIIIVDPEDLWFPGTLQGAVLLLAQKLRNARDTAEGIGIFPVRGRKFTHCNPEDIFSLPQTTNGKTVTGKWTRALLEPETRVLLDGLVSSRAVHIFSEVATADVGIVTGANNFFFVDDNTVKKFELDAWAHPMFGRSAHCPGIIYDDAQHHRNATNGNPTNFVWLRDRTIETTRKGKAYVEHGERQRLHMRYKCRIRDPWYTVPSVYSTEVGMLKRSHVAPRLFLNKLRAYTTDTAYRIKVTAGTAKQLVYAFINPLTALSAELEGRHYGGGVLELVPSEIERLLIPRTKDADPDVNHLDSTVRTTSMESVIEMQSNLVLGGSGLSPSEQSQLIDGWRKLKDRRQRITSVVD